jgi:YfiH family protein
MTSRTGTRKAEQAADAAEAIAAVDAIFAQGGLEHGRRASATAKASPRKPASQRGTNGRNGKTGTPRARTARAEGASAARANSAADRPGLIRIAAWKHLPWLRAGFSTRQGGGSLAYAEAQGEGQGEQNLSWTAEDPAATVAENRRRLVAAVAAKARMELVTLRQFHSGLVRVVERSAGTAGEDGHPAALATPEGKAILRGDALMTARAGLLLGIQTADCVPVLVADTRTRAVAAFHAGWRGTLARIVERGVGAMRLEFGSNPKDLVAAIGPGIGPCCFAVGEEVRFEFESQFAYSPELFSEVYDSDPVREKYPMLFLTARAPGHSNLGPQIHLDLIEANRRQLLDAGVPAEAISVVGECTACARLPNGRRKYFSHRAERGYTGRMLSVIGVAPGTARTK